MPFQRMSLPAAALLPHTGRMCCIDRLTGLGQDGEDRAEAEVLLRPGHMLLDKRGVLVPCGCVELAAQTAGAMYGAGAAAPRSAMLVTVQKAFFRGEARAGDRLMIAVAVLGEIEGMLSLGFAVSHEDRNLAEGRLTVFVPPQPSRQTPADPVRPVAFSPESLPEAVSHSLVPASRHRTQTDTGYACSADFVFEPDFSGFDGHFPGQPILPGIAQVMAAGFTADPAGRITGIKRCKFLRPVRPGETVQVQAETASSGECRAALSVGSEACAEMSLVLEPETGDGAC